MILCKCSIHWKRNQIWITGPRMHRGNWQMFVISVREAFCTHAETTEEMEEKVFVYSSWWEEKSRDDRNTRGGVVMCIEEQRERNRRRRCEVLFPPHSALSFLSDTIHCCSVFLFLSQIFASLLKRLFQRMNVFPKPFSTFFVMALVIFRSGNVSKFGRKKSK